MRNNDNFPILCTLATFCLYLLAQILYVTTPIHVIHSNPSFEIIFIRNLQAKTRITIFFLITVSNFFFCPEIIERSWFKTQKIVNKMHTFGSLNRLFGWLMEIIDFLPSLVTMCILFAEQREHKQHRNHHRSAKCQANDNTVGYLYTRAQFLSVSH